MSNQVQRQANALKRFLLSEGIGYEKIQEASTGSCYIHVAWKPRLGNVVIRVSDHADAYGTASYTIDGVEGTLAGAKAWIKENLADEIDHDYAVERGWRKA